MNNKARPLRYLALFIALAAVAIENPTSWVIIPLVAIIVATIAVDIATSRKGSK